MAKPTTIEQLRSKSWPSHAAAAKELKRRGFAERGDDYELKETNSGSWQICPLEEPPELARPRRSTKRTVVSLFPEHPPTEAPAPEILEPILELPLGTDLSALPAQPAEYYTIRINGAHLRQNSIVLQALEISKQTRLPAEVIGPDGVLLRIVDASAIAAARRSTKRQSRPAGRASAARDRYELTDEVAQQLVAALLENPLKAADVRRITQWDEPKMSIRNALDRIASRQGLRLVAEWSNPSSGRATLMFSLVGPSLT